MGIGKLFIFSGIFRFRLIYFCCLHKIIVTCQFKKKYNFRAILSIYNVPQIYLLYGLFIVHRLQNQKERRLFLANLETL